MVKLYPNPNLVEDSSSVICTAQMLHDVHHDGLGGGKEWLRRENQTILGSVFAFTWIASDHPYIQATEV